MISAAERYSPAPKTACVAKLRRQFFNGVGVLDAMNPAPIQLALIALGQAGGLSLDEIHAMLPPKGAPRVNRTLLLAKANEIDATIKHLRAMSEGLRHAAACPAENHAECPTFQRLLKAAAAGRLKQGVGRMAQTRDFYADLLGFAAGSEYNGRYIQMASPAHPQLQIGIVRRDHAFTPEAFRQAAQGLSSPYRSKMSMPLTPTQASAAFLSRRNCATKTSACGVSRCPIRVDCW